MTQTFLAFSLPVRNFAAAGPWTLSLPSARKKVVQPLVVSDGLVADGVMWTRPPVWKMPPVALDSPENGRPTAPMMSLLPTTWVTTPGAWAGSPAVSYFLKATWQPGLAVLCLLIASWMPL